MPLEPSFSMPYGKYQIYESFHISEKLYIRNLYYDKIIDINKGQDTFVNLFAPNYGLFDNICILNRTQIVYSTF